MMADKGLQELEKLRFPEGEKLFSQGDPADACYLIVQGKVGIYKVVDGRRLHLRTLMAGAIFGTAAVVDGGGRSTSAVTVAPTVLLRIPAPLLHAKLERTDPFVRQLVGTMAENLRDLHRVHQLRPRSVHDYVRLLQDQSENLRKFVINAAADVSLIEPLTAEVERLDAVIAVIRQTIEGFADRRSDAVLDPETLP